MSTLAEVILRDTRANQPAAGSTPAGTLYYVTDESVLERCTGAAWESYSAAAGLSNPMTTAEDIIVGGASGTPARLAVGTEGHVLSVSSGSVAWAAASGGSGLSTGSSFPGTPSTGDRYRRSDLDYEVYFYDGTRWVTETIYSSSLAVAFDTTAATFRGGIGFNESGLDAYLIRMDGAFSVNGTNNSSNYWKFDVYSMPADGSGGAGTILDTADTYTLAPGTDNLTGWTLALGDVIDVSTHPNIAVYVGKQGSPASIRGWAQLYWRYIAT